MTKSGIARVLRAVYRHEFAAYRSIAAWQRFTNPVGRGALRSLDAAVRHFSRAKQLRLGLESRIESESKEKKLSEASKEFRKVAPWKKKKRAA